MKRTHAVGIDLGTTYSCIAWLNEHGHPVTIPNQEGELSTPSVVFFDGIQPIVGTEALRNAIASPDRVVQHAKRFMGDSGKYWKVGDNRFNPVHISGLILRKLIAAAQEQIGEIREAVITVPAQFGDAQRHATILAGHAAGLERIEMINEPVAAALCHVLGQEGLAFTELAVAQQIMVFDLGGGTLDLAIVKYQTDDVRVIASDGDLELGGLDWTRILVDIAADRFVTEFRQDPRETLESLQFLTLEAEQAKRSLSVRSRAAVTVRHGNRLKTYQIDQSEFETASTTLLRRCEEITRRILKENKLGWARVDTVLTTGGASRMPMVRELLKGLSGRTLNTTLSPDQSIAHGAAYYAGMLISNRQYVQSVFNSRASERLSRVKQHSVNARSLGILIRDEESGQRVPHYLIPANTPLPVSTTHVFGTVVSGQTRVHVRIVESGAGMDRPPTILGDCEITQLPRNLPEGTEIEVTISYDRQARVHVTACEPNSQCRAEVELVRQDNLSLVMEQGQDSDRGLDRGASESTPNHHAEMPPDSSTVSAKSVMPTVGKAAVPVGSTVTSDHKSVKREVDDDTGVKALEVLSGLRVASDMDLPGEYSEQPVMLCNECGAALGRGAVCTGCGAKPTGRPEGPSGIQRGPQRSGHVKPRPKAAQPPASAGKVKTEKTADPNEVEFWDLLKDVEGL
jgi:molecular chaperone DnaK